MYSVLLEEGHVGLDHLLDVTSEDVAFQPEKREYLLKGAHDREPEAEAVAEGAAAEGSAGERDEARDLRPREAEVAELGDAGSQGFLHAGAEEARVRGDEGRDVGAREAQRGEEGDDGVGL